jgi:hypothetical protein
MLQGQLTQAIAAIKQPTIAQSSDASCRGSGGSTLADCH